MGYFESAIPHFCFSLSVATVYVQWPPPKYASPSVEVEIVPEVAQLVGSSGTKEWPAGDRVPFPVARAVVLPRLEAVANALKRKIRSYGL